MLTFTRNIFVVYLWKIVTSYCTFVFKFSPFFISVHSQKSKKDEDKKDEEFRCPEGQGNGNFADPATCRRFYQVIAWFTLSSACYDSNSWLSYFLFWKCVDGYPYLNRCPSGLHFDDISKFCTFKNEARCGPIETSEQIFFVVKL